MSYTQEEGELEEKMEESESQYMTEEEQQKEFEAIKRRLTHSS